VPEDETKIAPHGRDEFGEPKTPYGKNLDGTPRKSNRGARPGQRRAGGRTKGPAKKAQHSPTDEQRKAALCQLGEMAITGPLVALSVAPPVVSRIGQEQADAFAGDAVILTQFMPHLADGLIVLSQSKPAALAWLDTVEEKAPFLLLASVGVQLVKALANNHMNPNPNLAAAGRLQAQMNQEMMIREIERQAAEMGINVNGEEPTTVIPTEEAA
jgi:hypothetical protein